MFVDRVRIRVKGGNGGAGVTSFERKRGRPRGKPTGGSGGSGGSVILMADRDVATLLDVSRKPHWKAGSGTHGQGDLRHGAHGEELVLHTPLGTVVTDDTGVLLADLVDPGQQITVAQGGIGGRGNASFVTSRRRVATFSEQGEYGAEAWITLELKVLADAALVGFPNAGKSTLISRVSAARPKIADYPFTTLEPHLGIVSIDDREFAMADVPGLIEGAASGKGLGHKFLRHVERARVLVILVDPTPLQDVPAADQLGILRSELAAHSPDLGSRPFLLAINKIDAIDDADSAAAALGTVHDREVFAISAVTGEGVDRLLYAIADEVERHERTAPERDSYMLHRPVPPTFRVDREGTGWVVTGTAAERAVNLADLTVPEAADLVAERLDRIGVDAALARAGAQPGDDVRIGDLTFTFEPKPPASGDVA